MQASVLATKICVPPPRPHSISRPRLLARLEQAPGYDLVLVSAPAGFGKTTFLSQWAHADRSAATSGWLSLDQGDNDPVRFWDHFVAALNPLGPEIGREALALFHSPAPLPPEPALSALVNSLAGVDKDFAVVLDDYHCIESPRIHAGIAFLIDNMPARIQLIISTRADPPLPLARYRGRGSLLEIGTDDLRFTPGEATALLEELTTVRPNPQDVEALHRRTEGWAVGLKMAALSMQEGEGVSEFISQFTGSNRYVMDFLIEEVLQRQPGEVQRFLLETSLLDSFTAPLCDAVTGRTDGETMLRSLEVANLFMVPLDDSRVWYRYEHLFADLLRHQLEKTCGPDGRAELHRRAGRWFAEQELPGEAINHSLAALDWDTAMELLAVESTRQKQAGGWVTLLGWLRTIPKDVLRRRPELFLTYALAYLFTFEIEAAEETLADLESGSDLDSIMQGRVIGSRALIATMRRDAGRAMELSQIALRLLPPQDLEFRASLNVNLAKMRYEKGLLREAEPLLEEAYALSRRDKHPLLAVSALGLLSLISIRRGRLGQAMNQAQQGLELAGPSPAAALPHAFFAYCLYEHNDLDSAVSHLDRSFERSRLMGFEAIGHEVFFFYLARIRLARGNVAGALEAVNQIDSWVARDGSEVARARQAGYHLGIALRRRDVEEASRWGQAVADFGDLVPFDQRYLLIPWALLRGRDDEVEGRIRAYYESLQTDHLSPEWPYWRMQARIYQALAAPGWNEAREYLAEALALARPEGYVRIFADEGPALVPLLRKAISEGMETEFAVNLFNVIDYEDGLEGRLGQAGVPAHGRGSHGLLSEREVEILRLVAAGMSNAEIAARLYITVGTVKVHVHNISEKLNTSSRTKAVAQARTLHLL
jgi:LuxR family transcriptional regulator, maltose regulon positive regulatory protein